MSTSNSLHTCRAVGSALQITATTAGWCSLLHWSASVVMRQCCVWTYLLTWMSDRASFSSGRPSSLYLGWLLRWSITCKQAKLSLFGMALEMEHYLQDSSWPHHSECTISGFTFEQLTLEFGRHTVRHCAVDSQPASSRARHSSLGSSCLSLDMVNFQHSSNKYTVQKNSTCQIFCLYI